MNELLRNTAANVNPDEHWIYVPDELAKNKTSVRYVPIHDKVYPLVMNFYNRAVTSGSKALMTNPGGYPIAYNNFATRNLKHLNTQFETKHRMHDTRHTFATVAHQCGMDRRKTNAGKPTFSGIPLLFIQFLPIRVKGTLRSSYQS